MSSLSSLDVSSTLLLCKDSECVTNQDEDSLVCIKCMRLVHYKCTKLPAYQIHIINTKRNYPYYCQNCVVVPQELLDLVPNETDIAHLKREVKGCEALIDYHEDNEKKLQAYIDHQNLDLIDLRSKVKSDTLNYVEEKLNEKLENLKKCLLSSIKQECKNVTKSYADSIKVNKNNNMLVKNNPKKEFDDFEEVIKNARKEEISEELEQKKRSGNVVIHGIPEKPGEDNDWVKRLLKDLHTQIEIKRVSRIGTPKDEKIRPMLVALKNEDDKLKVLDSLWALRGKEKYKGVTVSEDLTQEQRKDIKKLSREARTRNDKDNSSHYVWRVRGSSKNGFFLKRITSHKSDS